VDRVEGACAVEDEGKRGEKKVGRCEVKKCSVLVSASLAFIHARSSQERFYISSEGARREVERCASRAVYLAVKVTELRQLACIKFRT
jgi:hypothetical protein